MNPDLDESLWFPPGLCILRGTLADDRSIAAAGAPPASDYVVYAVVTRADQAIPRANGRHSRLLYVGMGQRSRVQLLRDGGHGASRALDQFRRARGGGSLSVEIWFCPADNCSLHEVLILNSCLREYGELPPANRKWEGHLHKKVVREMAGWALAEEATPRGRVDVNEWPAASPSAVFADVMDGEAWRFSLAWFYTGQLLNGRRAPVPALKGQLVLIPGEGGGNELTCCSDFESWGKGGVLTSVAAGALDGLGAHDELHDWLARYTSAGVPPRGWRGVVDDALETLRRTLDEYRP